MSDNGVLVYVMRFKAIVDQEKVKLPDRTNGNPPPCTGTGFTGADDELIPEVTLVEGGLPIKAGAIYEIDSNGNEYMVAYWNKRKGRFVGVRGKR